MTTLSLTRCCCAANNEFETVEKTQHFLFPGYVHLFYTVYNGVEAKTGRGNLSKTGWMFEICFIKNLGR